MKQTLQSSNKLLSRRFKSATIFQSDIVGFTKISSALNAAQVVSLLHTLYEYYDQFTLECNVEKIETIGDAYICVNFTSSSSNVIEFALKVVDAHRQMQQFQVTEMAGNAPKSLEEALAENENAAPVIDVDVRCGIASGNVAGCVLGLAGLRFHLFGDALDHAITLEGASKTNRILVCNNTVKKNSNKFIKFEPHEELDAFYVIDTSRKVLEDMGKYWRDEKQMLMQDAINAMRESKSSELDHDPHNRVVEEEVDQSPRISMMAANSRDVRIEVVEEEEQKHDDGKVEEEDGMHHELDLARGDYEKKGI